MPAPHRHQIQETVDDDTGRTNSFVGFRSCAHLIGGVSIKRKESEESPIVKPNVHNNKATPSTCARVIAIRTTACGRHR